MWIDVGLTAKSIAPVPRHPRVSSLKFRKLTLLAPYTPSGVEGASKCCSSSGGVIGENVTGAAATIPGGEAEVSLEAFVAISMAVFAVVSPVVYPVVCLAKCLEVDRESPRRPEYGSLIEDAQK